MTFVSSTYQTVSDSLARCGAISHGRDRRQRPRSNQNHHQDELQEDGNIDADVVATPQLITQKQRDSSDGNNGWWQPWSILGGGDSGGTSTPGPPNTLERSQGTESTKSSDSSPKVASPLTSDQEAPIKGSKAATPSPLNAFRLCNQDTTMSTGATPQSSPRRSLMDLMDNVCTMAPFRAHTPSATTDTDPSLGISRLEAPDYGSGTSNVPAASSVLQGSTRSSESPAERRRQRHARRYGGATKNGNGGSSLQGSVSQSHHDMDFECTQSKVCPVPHQAIAGNGLGESASADESLLRKKAPLQQFTLTESSAADLERTISELTMRSSYGVATAKLQEHRRMAYYAVGKHHRQSGRGGNRRCYFTGKLILSGAPFYAGCVQQGLRTLVVFCLPSSLGLPHGGTDNTNTRIEVGSVLQSLDGGAGTGGGTAAVTTSTPISKLSPSPTSRTGARSILSRSKGSRLTKGSYVDEMSLSVGEELDPNWGLSTDYLLKVLPSADQGMLDEMSQRYPDQFETLPVQVRGVSCWRLYVKFCFFSGLPIAEGEMHYKVCDEVADIFGEDVTLSHDILEAVNGPQSAEILRLPNLKTFRYLQKHYAQQAAKLPDEVFQRKAWELIRAEV